MTQQTTIKNSRQAKGLTLRELSQHTGISPASLSRYERVGLAGASVRKVFALADALDCSVDEILKGTTTQNRLTLDGITSSVRKVEYKRVGQKSMICVLTLENGFEVVGESGVIDANFDEEIERGVSYRRAVDKVWQVEGYLLQERLYRRSEG